MSHTAPAALDCTPLFGSHSGDRVTVHAGSAPLAVCGRHAAGLDAQAYAAMRTASTKPRTYTATRIAARFFECIGASEDEPGDVFNVDAMPHTTDIDTLTFETMAELIAAVRRDRVTFEASGTDWACDPDGSQIVDYATAAREAVSWHFDGINPAMLARVIMPAVDARA